MRKIIFLMKSIFIRFLPALLASLFMVSCDIEPLNEDFALNNPQTGGSFQNENLFGDWELFEYTAVVTTIASADFGGQTVSQESVATTTYESGNITVTFNEDLSYTSAGEGIYSIVTVVDGNQVSSETLEEPFDTTAGVYAINGNNLTLTDNTDNIDTEFTITSFTATTLVLTVEVDEDLLGDTLGDVGLPDGFPDLGVDFTFSGTIDLTFTKVPESE